MDCDLYKNIKDNRKVTLSKDFTLFFANRQYMSYLVNERLN
jgi:hypothetical protein